MQFIKNFLEKLLAYNCSPSFNWKKHLSDDEISTFQQKISEMGYKFQFITSCRVSIHKILQFLNLLKNIKLEGMTAYSKIQELEFTREKDGYTSVLNIKEKLVLLILMQSQILLVLEKVRQQQWMVLLSLNSFN